MRGWAGLEKLARAINISTPGNVVHMAVMTSKIGRRVQVSCNGLLETNLERHREHLRVEGRLYEHTNAVRFTVTKFDAPQFRMPEGVSPDNNDWMVTGKGMLIIRFSWHSALNRLEWTPAVEAACLDLCERVTDWIQECC